MGSKKYLQLTYEDRRLISHWKAKGLSISQIALRINVHKSTVSRELRRNAWMTSWTAQDAKRIKEYRTYKANQKRRRKSPQIKRWVIEKLEKHWSPMQIAGRSKIDGPASVSHEYVYSLILQDRKRGGGLHRLLKRFRKRKQRLGARIYPTGPIIPNRTGIEQRPVVVQTRSRLGDLQGDLIQGYCHSGYVLSLIDRKSRYLVLRKLKSKRKRLVRIQLERAIRKLGVAKTLTLDNGTEFCDHQELTRITKVPVFFATPYRSIDRATNENANGLVRYYLPKKTCFRSITQSQLNKIQDLLNYRPRDCLGYLTPHEVHFNKRPQSLPRQALHF